VIYRLSCAVILVPATIFGDRGYAVAGLTNTEPSEKPQARENLVRFHLGWAVCDRTNGTAVFPILYLDALSVTPSQCVLASDEP